MLHVKQYIFLIEILVQQLCWIFKFHNVDQMRWNSLCQYIGSFLLNMQWKTWESWSIFTEVMTKIKCTYFLNTV